MKKRTKHIGLIMGAAMMAAVIGAGTALAAVQSTKTQKPAGTSAPAEIKVQEAKTDQKGDTKKETLFYGTVKKLGKDKFVLDEAVVLGTDAEGEKKSPAADTKTKDAGGDTSVSADFETAAMKWKLSGKTLEIKTDKTTKYVESVPEDTANPGKADAKTESGKKDQKDQKDSKAVELKDIKQGMFLKVTVKDDGSMTASEVLVLPDAKKVTPAGQEVKDKTAQPETKKS